MKKKLPDRWETSPFWKKQTIFPIFVFFFFFLLSFPASAHLSLQETVTLRMKAVTLNKVMSQIKKQAGVKILYNVDLLEKVVCEEVNLDDSSVEEALRKVLEGTGFDYVVESDAVVIREQKQQQVKEYQIKGRVTDSKGGPLPGVTIRLDGTSLGMVTDHDGNFVFRLPIDKGTLIFSFVGYKLKKTNFEGDQPLKVRLEEDISELDEVTVVAYGERKKRELVGSISSVKATDIKEVPTASLETLLQGRMAGVEINNQGGSPGGGGSIVAIRGYNSLFVGDGRDYGEPLYVIDGVPMHSFTSPITGTNALSEIDPMTIESVEVLKDAASGAIYGSRAGNGVILITTKKGQPGRASFSANVSYSYSILPEAPTQTGGRGERAFNFDRYKNERGAGYIPGHGREYLFPNGYEEAKSSGIYDRWWFNAVNHIGGQRILQDSLNPFYNNSTNWFRHVFRPGRIINANLQASGGSEKISYLVGAGYYTERGIMQGSDFSRLNLIANLNVRPVNNLFLDSRIYMAYTDRSRGAGTSGFMSGSKIEAMTVDPKKTSSLLAPGGVHEDQLMEELNSAIEKNESYRLRTNLVLRYQFLEGLNLSVTGSIDYNQGMRNNFRPSNLDPVNKLNTSVGEIDRNLLVLNENMLTFRRSFAEKHNVDALFGISYQSDQSDYIMAQGRGGPNDLIHYIVDESNAVDINGETVYLKGAKTNRTEKVLISYYARLGYNYMQRYLIEGTWRRDGSSVFGQNVRWAVFPSVAVGWAFSQEEFMQWAGWLNYGKFRMSWGRSGQQFGQPYLAHGLLDIGGSFLGNNSMVSGATSGMLNRNLTWEESDQYDFGLDMDMFNYRFKFKLDYYYKKTRGLLYPVPLGGNWNYVTMQWQNAMQVSNEGLELETEIDIFRESAISWRMRFNISKNWNRFTKSYTGRDVDAYVIGRPLYSIFTYEDDGYYRTDEEIPYVYDKDGNKKKLFVGTSTAGNEMVRFGPGMRKIEDVNGDGKIGPDDMVYKASALPLAYGGWVNEVKWKGFDLNVLFTYSIGRKMYKSYNMTSMSGNVDQPIFEDVQGSSFWENPGDQSDFPRLAKYHASLMQFEGAIASNLENVHYLKMKQLTIGYNVPDKIVKSMKLSGIRVFFTGENLFTLTNYSGLDPEVVSIYSGKDDFGYYPLSRKMSVGLTVNF